MLTADRSNIARAREHWPAAVVFDLDGTIVNSLGDITSSINTLLAAYGHPLFSESAIREFVGDGMDALVERAFSARGVVFSPKERETAIRSYELTYGARLTDTTRPYAGVVAVISELRERGVSIGVCTNKAEDQAVSIVEGLGLRGYVDAIVGARRGRPAKPSPIPLLHTLEYLRVNAADAIMVGDSAVDVQCAKAAGVAVIGVSFGYSRVPMRVIGPNVTIDDFGEFKAACASLRVEGP
ncbi:MAG: HAD-IA family hydrolase [Afipia sp.]|nr:HAD-IA family hydrolase [Afipia sp.]